MVNTSACPRCNSEKVVPRVRVKVGAPYGGDIGGISAATYENPEAMVFRHSHESSLYARVCGECGHAELFVENPKELYEGFINSR